MTQQLLESPVPLENMRVSQEARDRLIQLKKKTGIGRWNTLCRWAVCRSLAEPSPPPVVQIPADSNVEMDWKTFAGPYSDLFIALLRLRCETDRLPLDQGTLAIQFRLHLHRGIAYLAADRRIVDIASLIGLAIEKSRKSQTS